MKQLIQNSKGVLLAAAIILFYIGIVTSLQAIAVRHYRVPGGLGKAAAIEAGMEMRGFTITAYCPGSCCNGIWAGLTASGRSIDYYVRRKINIAAVDPSVIPMGTLFVYGGREYLAVDVGGLIRGRKIDLLVPTHRDTLRFGVRKDQSIVILPDGARETALREPDAANRVFSWMRRADN